MASPAPSNGAGPPLAVTQGEPAGIGPEITLEAWLARDETGLPPFFVVGDPALYARLAARLCLPVPVVAVSPGEARGVFRKALPVVPLGLEVAAEPGRPNSANAAATLRSIELAVSLVQRDEAAAVVTAPIAKHVLYEAGFTYPGHTEFLAALAAKPDTSCPHPVMMLWSEELAVVPVTVHIPLRAVPDALSTELILVTARIVDRDLRARFGLAAPRIALAGLNPHAGEAGALGAEDSRVVAPAAAQLRAEGLDIAGPYPADTMFHPRARKAYDVALAMYHDQALIPIKTIAFDEAVNVTLGLPFVRTSPDHGTAFDIAGRGIARPDSLTAALRLAARLAASRGQAEA